MTVEWSEAPKEIIELAEEIIDEFHPHLKECSIGFLARSEMAVSSGRQVWGQAQKVSPKMATLLDLDFLIWIALDAWWLCNSHQKRALIDHELCHCQNDDKLSIIGHDIEEFEQIIVRYGLWSEELRRVARPIMEAAQQLEFDLPDTETEQKNGRVVAVNPEIMQGQM